MESKAVFITGVSKGIGASLYHETKKQGFMTFGIGRSNPELLDSFLELDLLNNEALDSFQLPNLSKEIKEVWLINNAGLIGPISHVASQDYKQIKDVFQVNLIAAIQITNLFLETYSHIESIKVINISSGAAHSIIPSWATYCASKAGLEMYSTILQAECDEANRNVKVYAVAPGVVDTEMQGEIRSSDANTFSSRSKFVEMKANGDLKSPDIAAHTLIKLIENQSIPGSYTLRDYYEA